MQEDISIIVKVSRQTPPHDVSSQPIRLQGGQGEFFSEERISFRQDYENLPLSKEICLSETAVVLHGSYDGMCGLYLGFRHFLSYVSCR